MKQQFGLIQRPWGVYYLKHKTTGVQTSLKTRDRAEAERLLKQTVEGWATDAPKLASWAEENLPDGFTTFELPLGQRPRLRTTNCLERVNRELKRRTRVASIFPNTASCLRLVSALLAGCGVLFHHLWRAT